MAESSACVYGVDEGMDGFDRFVEVGDRHVEAAGHGGVAVAPGGVGRDLWWPVLLITCGEYALAGVLDGRELLPGWGLVWNATFTGSCERVAQFSGWGSLRSKENSL
jgi:hypothetical protein